MDRDGYSDLAVGAPYEDQGVVYIYRGSAKGIVRKYSQRIDASVMLSARPLSTFGYSLSGGIDMDSNGYPDLVVGAYGSDKVLILRSRPVVNVTASMISNPNLIDPKVTRCITDGTPYNCFSIRVCFRFKADPPDRFSRKMDLQFKLEAEKFTGQKIVRVFFESGSSHILEKTIKMNEQSNPQPKCRSYGVKIKRQNKDFLNPIMFRLTYKLPDKPPPTSSGGRLPNINNYPILNEAAAQEDLEVHFQKNCGTDKVCHSDLEIRAELGGLDVDNEGNAVLKVGQVNTISLIVTVVNRKEDAHYTTLNVTIPDSLSYVGTRSDRRQYSCTPGNHTILCLLGNPMSQNQVASFTIILDAKEIRPFVSTLDFALRVNTTSTEVNPGNNAMFLRANVIVEADMYLQSNSDPNEVFYGGKVRGESAITYEDEIGPQVVHSYEVKNSGPGKVVNSTVVISWPYEVEWGYPQGKHVLYLMQEPEVDAPGKCVLKPNMVNPLGIQEIAKFRLEKAEEIAKNRLEKAEKRPRAQQETDIISYNASEPRSRRRRATVETVQDSGSVKQYRVITLDCRRRTAKCFKIRCHIGEMRSDQSVLIRLRARLWNSTFLEDYRKIDYVRIWSRAEISIDKRLNIRQPDVSNDVAICETKAIPDIQIVEGPGVPLWVIIVAAIAGILLLLVIVLALWKCGFFKRKKPEDMRRHKGKVEKKKNSYYEDGDY